MILSSLTSRLRTAGAVAMLALISASGAKADNVEIFDLSGTLYSFSGSSASFFGAIDLDFSDNFDSETLTSLAITVPGRLLFDLNTSVTLIDQSNQAVISVSNSAEDTLTLMFSTPNTGAWTGFNTGSIFFGEVIFGDLTGMLFGASGVVTRDSLDASILAPSPVDPPPGIDPPTAPAAVPEVSTWAMMLVGLTGLGFAAKRRRAFAVLRERA